jgi:Predicted periplasmic lipoprotein (DUF2279)
MMKRLSVFWFAIGISFSLLGQSDTIRPNYKRLHTIFALQSATYIASVYGLSHAWYKSPFQKFSFNDDSHEWLQIDKIGHTFTSFQIAKNSALLYKNTGISKRQAAAYGAISGFMFMTPIEILDGFQYPDYGFSVSDLAANVVGPSIFLLQSILPDSSQFQFKYSFHQTSLAQVRPYLLGKNLSEQWLKDYNGQIYWISVPIRTLIHSKKIPTWICLSFGYGIQNMVSAEKLKSRFLGYEPYRQYYLSFDIDLQKIKTKNKTLKSIFSVFNTLKFPAPTLEWNAKRGFKSYLLYP